MRKSDVGEANKFKILQCLASENSSKSTSTISTETGLHRDTVHSLCRTLIAADLIVKGPGRWGRYSLTEKAFGDPRLLGWVFAKRAFKEILRKGDVSIIGCKYSKLDCEDLTRGTDREIECRLLFKYALLCGAYLLYVFLKSFEPPAIKPPHDINKRKRKIEINGRHKDELSHQWVKNAIQPYAMLAELRKQNFVKRYLKPYSGSGDISWGFNVIADEKRHEKLMSEFAEVFSGVSDLLEEVWRSAKPEPDKYRKHYSKSIADSSSATARTTLKEGKEKGR